MKMVELTEEHLRAIKVREFERTDLGDNFLKEQGEDFLSSEFKKAFIDQDGEIVFIFGTKETSRHGVWVWMIASDLLYKHRLKSIKLISDTQNARVELDKAKGIRYYYTFNRPDFPFAIKFLERIGYVQKDKAMFDDGVERILLIKEF